MKPTGICRICQMAMVNCQCEFRKQQSLAPDLMGDPGPAEAMVRRAVERERKECARIVSGYVSHVDPNCPCDACVLLRRAAAAIRARGSDA